MMLSCQDSPLELGEQAANFQATSTALNAESSLAEVSYEIESTTRILPNQPSETTLDRITMVPQVSRDKVQMNLYSNGTTSWVIETLTPAQDVIPDHEDLPNDLPVPVKFVVSDGAISLYDKNGAFMGRHPMETPPVTTLAENIIAAKGQFSVSSINQAILSMQGQAFNSKLLALLNNPAAYGATVSEMGSGIVNITMSAQGSGIPNQEGNVETIVDVNRNLLLGSRLYGEDGNLKSSTMIQYEQGSNPYIKGILQQVEEKLPSGQAAVMETYMKISGLTITIN